MASKVTHAEFVGTVYVITVEHLDTDSFSRSVSRAANKQWRALTRHEQLAARCVTARFGHTDLPDRRCVSTVVYGPSHEACDALLDYRYGFRR